MNGLHRMFLGDARVNSANDEWVFNDPDSIRSIVIPAVRIAVKVHQVRWGGGGGLAESDGQDTSELGVVVVVGGGGGGGAGLRNWL